MGLDYCDILYVVAQTASGRRGCWNKWTTPGVILNGTTEKNPFRQTNFPEHLTCRSPLSLETGKGKNYFSVFWQEIGTHRVLSWNLDN